jgi:hypothetical protein
MANIDSVTFSTTNPTKGEEVTATVKFRAYADADFNISFANASSSTPITVQGSTPPPPPPPPPPPSGDPRGALFDRTDLVFGSQIGAWDENCSTLSGVPLAVTNAEAADIRVIRWQMWQVPQALGGAQTTADFLAGIEAIQAVGAIPLLGLPPIYNEQYPGGTDPWSYAWQQFMVAQACPKGVVLFEMGNEPDNYGNLTATEYFNTLWVNVPPLKAYARSLGYEIFVGGPAWANSYLPATENDTGDMETFLSLCKASYTANNNDRDWIPDFISTHCYLESPSQNATTADAQVQITAWGTFYDDLRTYINTEFAGLTDQGYPIAQEIKLVNSEWNWTIEESNTTYPQTTAFMDYYIPAMFDMMTAAAPDGSQRVWMSNQFTLVSQQGNPMDMLEVNGTAKPEYTAYKAASTAVPVQT